MTLQASPRNVFDQFEQRENRLTHALVVTLDKDRAFLAAFIRKFAPGTLNDYRRLRLAEQRLAGVAQEVTAEQRGLPDALIVAPNGRAIALETKLTAGIRLPQLQAHTATMERRLTVRGSDVTIRCVRGLLVTGGKAPSLPKPWHHVGWRQVYDLLCTGLRRQSAWTNELQAYLELVERRMSDEEVGNGIQLTRFNGVPFARGEEYTYFAAKRVLRLLMSELRADKKLLKALELPSNTVSRDAITQQPTLWDFLSAKQGDTPFNKRPHFTVGLGRERAEALLTVPNAAKQAIRQLGSLTAEQFEYAVAAYLQHLRRAGVLRSGATPRILMQQRRYLSQRSLPFTDGRIEFDPRLGFPKYCEKATPRLHPQQEWLRTTHHLLVDRSGNLQFQIGCVFEYRSCKAARSNDILSLYRGAWEAGKVFLETAGISI